MTAADPDEAARPGPSRRELSARRAEVFGDVLPEGTSDERGDGWGERDSAGSGAGDEWLRGQVPPHHG